MNELAFQPISLPRIQLPGLAISATAVQEPGMEEKYEALLNRAVTEKRLLIPALVGEGEPTMPLFLRNRHPADLRHKDSTEWDAVVEKIARALRGQRVPRVCHKPTRARAGGGTTVAALTRRSGSQIQRAIIACASPANECIP